MSYVAFVSDEREGESYVNGPFDSFEQACKWANEFVVDKAKEYGLHANADGGSFAWIRAEGDEDEVVLEVTVMTLIAP